MAWDFSKLLHQSYSERQKQTPFSRESVSEKSMVYSFQYLYILNGPVVREEEFIRIDSRIDDRSKVILGTFNDILKHTFSPIMETPVIGFDCAKESQPRDFSNLVTCLARVLEIELNLSFVQWVRMKKGIEMPNYFNRVKEGCPQLVVNICDKEIFVNQNRQGKLATLSFGDIQCLMKGYKDDLPNPLRSFASDFLQLWSCLKKKRNEASHTNVIDESDFLVFYKCFCSILEKGWLKALMDMKEQLSTK